MSSTITVDENIEQIMTEAAEACARTLDRLNNACGLAQRGRISRNSNAYRDALGAWDSAETRYRALVDMWAAVTGADEAERNKFYDRFMFPAKEAIWDASEARRNSEEA